MWEGNPTSLNPWTLCSGDNLTWVILLERWMDSFSAICRGVDKLVRRPKHSEQ